MNTITTTNTLTNTFTVTSMNMNTNTFKATSTTHDEVCLLAVVISVQVAQPLYSNVIRAIY
jgi:hypothetical protein